MSVIRPRFHAGAIWVLTLLVAVPGAPAAAPPPYAGLTLERALRALTDQGLPLVFSSKLVRPEMRVEREPTAGDPRRILDQLLAPHRLTVRPGPGNHLLIVRAAGEPRAAAVYGSVHELLSGRPLAGVEIRFRESGREVRTKADGSFFAGPLAAGRHTLEARLAGFGGETRTLTLAAGETAEIELALMGLPVAEERIDVVSERSRILGEGLSTLTLEGRQVSVLPHLAEDVIRGVSLLPGTARRELSARPRLRGGRADEVMVRLDGLEIVEPYHLQDFDGALSILSPAVIGSLELHSGDYSVARGDRMSGVLELTTVEPDWRRRTEVSMTPVSLHGSSSGNLAGDRGRWLTSLRAGSLELALKLADEAENPRFWDAFGKFERQMGRRHDLRGNLLHSDDRLNFTEREEDGTRERFNTSYLSTYVWLTHLSVLRSELFVETRGSFTRTERDRRGGEAGGKRELSVRDERALDMAGVEQEWGWHPGPRHEIEWGFSGRFLDARYDYAAELALSDPLARIRHQPPDDGQFRRRFRGSQYALYAADHLKPSPALSLDLGLRLDGNTVIDDEPLTSPRFNLAYALGAGSQLRFAWGHFTQSQRLYELQVEDGETRFSPSERAEQVILGFEHAFGAGVAGRPPLSLRLELYQRRIHDPRRRFENLFEPLNLVPELAADRVRIAPQSSVARGVEVFLRGAAGRRLDYFVSYTRATSRDRLASGEVPRGDEQPDALRFDLNFRAPRQWNVNLAGTYHAGWPTTALTARLEQGAGGTQIVPVLGPLYGERLPPYRRLDLRLSRRFAWRSGTLRLSFDLRNLTGARNVRGFAFSFEPQPDGQVRVVREAKHWPGLLPSFGISWTF